MPGPDPQHPPRRSFVLSAGQQVRKSLSAWSPLSGLSSYLKAAHANFLACLDLTVFLRIRLSVIFFLFSLCIFLLFFFCFPLSFPTCFLSFVSFQGHSLTHQLSLFPSSELSVSPPLNLMISISSFLLYLSVSFCLSLPLLLCLLKRHIHISSSNSLFPPHFDSLTLLG